MIERGRLRKGFSLLSFLLLFRLWLLSLRSSFPCIGPQSGHASCLSHGPSQRRASIITAIIISSSKAFHGLGHVSIEIRQSPFVGGMRRQEIRHCAAAVLFFAGGEFPKEPRRGAGIVTRLCGEMDAQRVGFALLSTTVR